MPEISDRKQLRTTPAQSPWQPRQPIHRRCPSGNRTSAIRTAHSSATGAGPWRRTAGRLAAQTAGWLRRRPTVELRAVAPTRQFVHTHPSLHTTAALRRPAQVKTGLSSTGANRHHCVLHSPDGPPRASRKPGREVARARPVFAADSALGPTCAERSGQSRSRTPLYGVLRAGGPLGLSNGFARATHRCRSEHAREPRS